MSTLGRTGFEASVIGIGDVADRSIPVEACVATVRRALDFGWNVVDTAPGYENGYSERIVGRALAGRRDGVFLIDKIDDLEGAVTAQVDASLERLGLSQVDLFVFHAVSRTRDWERLSKPGGPMDELASCVRAGKARFRGISSHHPDVLVRAIASGSCDVVLFPVGPKVDRRYVCDVLPLARKHRVGTVCFKTFGAGKLLGDTSGYGQPLRGPSRGIRMTVAECVRYTLTRGPDVALLGMSVPSEQDAVRTALDAFVPMTEGELAEAERHGADAVLGKGSCHWDPDG